MKFTESEMIFELEDDKSFRIEEDSYYIKISKHHVKTVECVTWHEKYGVLFIEAKKSVPNINADEQEKKKKLADFIQGIKQKFSCSIQYCYAHQHGRIPADAFGKALHEAIQKPKNILFILIINNYGKENCNLLQTKLRLAMIDLLKLWNAELLVWNDEIAMARHLVKKRL